MDSLIFLGDNVQDVEVIYPWYRLSLEGNVDIVSINWPARGVRGVPLEKIINKHPKDIHPDMWQDYDLLVLPGGVIYMEKARLDDRLINLIRQFHDNGKVIATICHGAQMIIQAGLARGRKLLGYYSIRTDIENAGGVWPDGVNFASDDRIVSAAHYHYMAEWLECAIEKAHA